MTDYEQSLTATLQHLKKTKSIAVSENKIDDSQKLAVSIIMIENLLAKIRNKSE